jgi:hypothetical protein
VDGAPAAQAGGLRLQTHCVREFMNEAFEVVGITLRCDVVLPYWHQPQPHISSVTLTILAAHRLSALTAGVLESAWRPREEG